MKSVEVALKIKAQLGECPRWDERAKLLYWVDINACQLHRFDPLTCEDSFIQLEEEIGCFVLKKNGGFVLAMRSGFYFMNEWGDELEAICDPEADLKSNRFNDGRCDAAGRFIVGSVYPPKDRDGANIWVLDTNLTTRLLVDGMLTSNGAAFSPDMRTFYYANTPKHVIFRCDYNLQSGEIGKASIFHQFEFGNGRPDGAAVDEEGCYWTALYEGGRIARLNPAGHIIEEIAVPAKCPTMVAFGDADLKTLYITSVGNRPEEELVAYPHSGSIFKVRTEVAGLAEHRFGA